MAITEAFGVPAWDKTSEEMWFHISDPTVLVAPSQEGIIACLLRAAEIGRMSESDRMIALVNAICGDHLSILDILIPNCIDREIYNAVRCGSWPILRREVRHWRARSAGVRGSGSCQYPATSTSRLVTWTGTRCCCGSFITTETQWSQVTVRHSGGCFGMSALTSRVTSARSSSVPQLLLTSAHPDETTPESIPCVTPLDLALGHGRE